MGVVGAVMNKRQKNKVGDVMEVSLWFNFEKPGEAEKAKEGIYKAFILTEEKHGVRLGPVDFEVLAPGDERVPEPPGHFGGTPKLMLGFAIVEKLVYQTIGGNHGFTQDLEPDDLETLRALTRKAHKQHKPLAVPLTDEQADTVINEVGPETAMKSLDSGTDERILS